jgi:hypothetical protein
MDNMKAGFLFIADYEILINWEAILMQVKIGAYKNSTFTF